MLALWTVTFIVTGPNGTGEPQTLDAIGANAGDAMLAVIRCGQALLAGTGQHYAVTGAEVILSDWMNSDIPAATGDFAPVGHTTTKLTDTYS